MFADAAAAAVPDATAPVDESLRALFALRPADLMGEGQGPLPVLVPGATADENLAPALTIKPESWQIAPAAMRLAPWGALLSALIHASVAAAAFYMFEPKPPQAMELPSVDIELVAPAEPPPAPAAEASPEPVAEPQAEAQPTPPEPVVETPPPPVEEPPPVEQQMAEAPPVPEPPPEIVLDPPPVAELPLPAELIPPTPPEPKPPEPKPVVQRPPPVVQPRRVATVPPRREPPREVRRPVERAERRPPVRAAAAPSTASAGRGVSSEQSQRTSTPPPSYLALVIAQLHRAKPAGSGEHGRAVVSFAILRSGAATGVSLARSSGVAAIDQAATAMVRRASPFPPLPSEFAPGSMSLTVPINFR
ncbi:energy transducer TonB family protein [Phreatobacter aquaticus]|nr:energy transducer TonB [Phreatobacter aquaticus]